MYLHMSNWKDSVTKQWASLYAEMVTKTKSRLLSLDHLSIGEFQMDQINLWLEEAKAGQARCDLNMRVDIVHGKYESGSDRTTSVRFSFEHGAVRDFSSGITRYELKVEISTSTGNDSAPEDAMRKGDVLYALGELGAELGEMFKPMASLLDRDDPEKVALEQAKTRAQCKWHDLSKREQEAFERIIESTSEDPFDFDLLRNLDYTQASEYRVVALSPSEKRLLRKSDGLGSWFLVKPMRKGSRNPEGAWLLALRNTSRDYLRFKK